MASLVNVLPLPPSPYTSAAKSLAQFSSGLVAKSLEVDKPGTQDPKASLDIPFYGKTTMPTGRTRCMGNLEVGAYALIDAWPTTGNDDYVDINRPTNYCMWAEPGGAASNLTFWFKKRQSIDPTTGVCTGTGDPHVLANPHVGVLITAISKDDSETKSSKNEADLPIGISRLNDKLFAEPLTGYSRETRASLHLCQELKIPILQCLGFDAAKIQEKDRNQLKMLEQDLLK